MSLDLGSVLSTKIYVKSDASTGNKAKFSTDDTNYNDPPINWNPLSGNEDPLVITWVFKGDAVGIIPKSNNITLLASVAMPSSSSPPSPDSFKVVKSDGSSEDPQIVVTPQ